MISEKMKKLAGGNSAIRAMFEEGKRLASIYGSENVYDYSLGNPYFPTPEKVAQSIKTILETQDSTAVHGYMSNAGFEEVRAAVAENLNRRFGTNFGEKNIIMTVGAAGGLNVILKALLNPGDEVLVFSPYFVEYGNYVSNYDGVLKVVPTDKDTFMPSPEALEQAVTDRTAALILNSPNNPTGVIYPPEVLTAIAAALERASEKIGRPIYIISDEPYRELVYDGKTTPWLTSFYRNTIVGYSWSKSLSLPGERIGYIVVPDEADDSELILSAAAIANRVLGFVNAPSLMQKAVAMCLDEVADIAAYDANRRLLYDMVTELGFESTYPDGAFYLWMKSPEPDEKAFVEKAKAHCLLLVPGSSFAWPGYVRLAYCVSPDMIKRSRGAFEALSAEYGLK